MRLAYCCSKDLAKVLRQRVNKVRGMKRVQQDTTPSHAPSGQRILFTGPDGIGDFRPKLDYFPRSIGIGPLSPDATSDLNYLFRPAAHATPPLPKHRCTGEVGWGLQYCTALNRRATVNNHKLYQVCSKDGYGESTTRRMTFSLEIDISQMILESDHGIIYFVHSIVKPH